MKINPASIGEAEATLPPELRSLLRPFAEDYIAACEKHVKGQPRVNYKILAELLRGGWRKTS